MYIQPNAAYGRVISVSAAIHLNVLICAPDVANLQYLTTLYISHSGAFIGEINENNQNVDSNPGSHGRLCLGADAERMDGFVEDGTITAWGWLSHHTGGRWMRVFYHQAKTMDGLMDAYDKLGEGQDEEEAEEFGQICNAHDDYIWQVMNGSQGGERGEAGFSVYHTCDISREARADEIVDEHFAPILNAMVEEGKLTSWGWSACRGRRVPQAADNDRAGS